MDLVVTVLVKAGAEPKSQHCPTGGGGALGGGTAQTYHFAKFSKPPYGIEKSCASVIWMCDILVH